jgi:putative ABC transport system permease protein
VMGDSMQLVIRTVSAPMSIVRTVRQQIHSVDPGQPVAKTQTAEELLRAEGWAREQFVASLFLVLAMLALALAATGLYSVVSYATALRSQEFGIRMALGAQKAHVIRLVLGSAVKTVSTGIVVGLALSLACNSLIAHWVSSSIYDPAMLGIIAVLLFGVTGLAAFVPARRAASCDPIQVLRAE